LERQKLLRETDTQEIPSGILRVYEHRKTGDVYIIKDPQIPLSEVDRVQEEVRQLLDPDPEPEAAESTGTSEENGTSGEETPECPEDSEAGSEEEGDATESENTEEEE
ncbi:hypothetical protein N9227_00600, partial [bacterium]|nr:hypothetical protein [bacterium]